MWGRRGLFRDRRAGVAGRDPLQLFRLLAVPFAAAAVLASLGGGRLANWARPETLSHAFAILLAVLAVGMAVRSLLVLL